MHREDEFVVTNIRLPKGDLRALKHEALRTERSVNALLRDMIRKHLRIGKRPVSAGRRRRSIWDLPEYAQKTGEAHLAERVDDIVYGA